MAVPLTTSYLRYLTTRPVLTKTLTGLSIISLGDLFSQVFIEKKNPIDNDRLNNVGFYGALVYGFVGHFWFRGLDRYFGAAQKVKPAMKKMAVD